MSVLNNLYEDQKRLVGIVSAASIPHGIFRMEKLNEIPWETITPPFCSILASDPIGTNEWGFGPSWYTVVTKVVFVAAIGAAGQRQALITTAEAYALLIAQDAMQVGQVIEMGGVDVSDENMPNLIFVAKDMKHRAATVTFTTLINLGDQFG
jgi:hypothetical protein